MERTSHKLPLDDEVAMTPPRSPKYEEVEDTHVDEVLTAEKSPNKEARDSFIAADKMIKEQNLQHVASTSTANFEKESESF
jgi:hypothetical protein